MTYDELIAIVEAEIIDLDDSWNDNKPLLIERAQLRIQRTLDLNADRLEDTIIAAESQVYLPDDLIILRLLQVENGEYLSQKDISFVRSYWPNPVLTGVPKYYAYVDDQIIQIAPTPDDASLVISYTVRLPILGPDQSSNWLSEYTPELLQYSLLMEMGIWTKDNQMMQVYRALFSETLNTVATEYNLRKRTDEFKSGEPIAGGAV
jgi:hypothetical protein